MISNYKVKVNDSCNYKVSITDIQNKYKFKLFCAGADLTDYYTKEQVDQSQNTQDILIDNLLNQIPTGTATGETINITDSSSLPLKDIQVAGNTYQETTTGKNLLPRLVKGTTEFNGKTYSVDENGILTMSGTPTRAGAVNIQFQKPYQITSETRYLYLLNNYKDSSFGVRFMNNDTRIFEIIPNPENRILDLSQYSGETITDIQIYQNLSFINTRAIYPMICTNNSQTTYEPYTNGDTPNPDYPQTITNVTGANTIKINGKNLFDGILEIGNFNSNTGEKIANNDYIINTNPIPVEELTNYKISSNGTGIRMYVFEYKEDMTYNLSVRKTVNADSYLTTNSGTKYINFRTVDANTNLQEKIQVEKGTTATTYEAYKEQSYPINLGSIELCKIGDYKDRIYYSSGKWYLEKNIGKVVLDGTQTINLFDTSKTNTTRVLYQKFVQGKSSSIALYCSHLVGVINWNVDVEGMYINNNDLVFRMNKTTIGTTIAEINNWLSNNNVTLEYALATPTTTEITDATLVSQLDALLNSTTYKTTTNITIDTTNQKPTLTLTYRKDLETLIGG